MIRKPYGVLPTVTSAHEFYTESDTGCWVWKYGLMGNGYSSLSVNSKTVYGHRFFYELFKGPIPEGLHIDHLCRNRSCVNPAHLETVTQAENNRRMIPYKSSRKVCSKGHEFIGGNVLTGRHRKCRICYDEYRQRYNEERRLARRGEE